MSSTARNIITGEIVTFDEVFPPAENEPTPVPTVVSRFQARAALMDAGLLADVELAIVDAGPMAQLAWEEATEWRRDSPTIAALAESLSLSSEDLDNLFIHASSISA